MTAEQKRQAAARKDAAALRGLDGMYILHAGSVPCVSHIRQTPLLPKSHSFCLWQNNYGMGGKTSSRAGCMVSSCLALCSASPGLYTGFFSCACFSCLLSASARTCPFCPYTHRFHSIPPDFTISIKSSKLTTSLLTP